MTTVPLFCRVEEVARKSGTKAVALVPTDRPSFQKLSRVKIGRILEVETTSARNPKQLALLWALATKIAENCERFDDKDHVVFELKMNTGHVERRRINIPGLGVVFQEWPASIAYDSMSQADFCDWFRKAIAYVLSDIWPGMPEGTIRSEIEEMIGEDLWPSPAPPSGQGRMRREEV